VSNIEQAEESFSLMMIVIRPELLTGIFALRSVPCTEEFDWHRLTFLAKEERTQEFNRGNGGAYV
jgi:hypothetical protein